jgi:phosphoribosylformylglycinamidine synthase
LLSTETFGLKLRFIRSKQSKTEWRKRVLTIIKPSIKLYFSNTFHRKKPVIDASKPRPKAAIIREKGSNSEREMANAMYLAGFDVKDVHMTDLISGRETLEDIQFIGAVVDSLTQMY